MKARATAYANIALAKYWGKASVAENLPAVPSLSLTLEGLRTVTEVEWLPNLPEDELELDGASISGRPRERVVALLDRVRALTHSRGFARVRSHNEFPTGAGLASSASGFAALALAATRAAGLTPSLEEVSALARASSASAARSVFGGFVSLEAGAKSAVRVAPPEHFPLAMLVTLTAQGPKALGSTEGMQRTADSSPYYGAWVAHAPELYREIRAAVETRDLPALGAAMEQSALMMHASMLAARPAVIYFTPTTLAVMLRVRAVQSAGTPAFFTMDAGPHVKVLCLPEHAERVKAELESVPGVHGCIECRPGPDASVSLEDRAAP
jgi:diphosphomevalonate decarboxylase